MRYLWHETSDKIKLRLGGILIRYEEIDILQIFKFEKTHSNVKISIEGKSYPECRKALMEREMDLVLSVGHPPKMNSLGVVQINDLPYIAVSVNNPLSQLDEIDDLTDLQGQNVFTPSPYHLEKWLVPALKNCGTNCVVKSEVLPVIKSMIAMNNGVMIIPKASARAFRHEQIMI